MFGTTLFFIFCYSLLLMVPRYSLRALEESHEKKKSQQNDLKEFLNYLVPKQPHFVTSIILDACILVMITMLLSGVNPMSPNGEELIQWGANRRPDTIDGQWWRLVTSMFVHGGIVHLIFNLYGLVMGAMFLESMLGPVRYAIIYFVSGIVASVASIVWYPYVASVGASGAIFGLFGANIALAFTDHLSKELRSSLLRMFGPYIVINLLWGLFSQGIDNAAHIGGLVSGFLIGLIIFQTMEPKTSVLE
jgi:rhomboid protease GluP